MLHLYNERFPLAISQNKAVDRKLKLRLSESGLVLTKAKFHLTNAFNNLHLCFL